MKGRSTLLFLFDHLIVAPTAIALKLVGPGPRVVSRAGPMSCRDHRVIGIDSTASSAVEFRHWNGMSKRVGRRTYSLAEVPIASIPILNDALFRIAFAEIWTGPAWFIRGALHRIRHIQARVR
jgi:hypothetical protein